MLSTHCTHTKNRYNRVRWIGWLLLTLATLTCAPTSQAQFCVDDSAMRCETATRIAQKYGFAIDWRQFSLMQLMDAETRMDTAARIEQEFGVTFDWSAYSLRELMDAEARMGCAVRLSQATGTPVDWRAFSLQQLLEMETRLSGGGTCVPPRPGVRPRPVPPPAARGIGLFVIAPSASTSMEARAICMKQGWTDVPLRQARGILVVVRSMLFNPLRYSYDSVKDLGEDANRQLNVCGESFHVYLYDLDSQMRPNQRKHLSYKASD